MNAIEKIKKAISEDKLLIGENSTKRALKSGKALMVVISNNTPPTTAKELESLCKIGKAEFVKSEKDNVELGVTCRKPFSVSVLSIKK
ncbi:MAG: ribosomal L7Ae/L30e/S12e/Gadd45 family protein [Candidatus Nanoarchaeia archaeon]|nr:ribosomal L7Ae/L30e/S12e/Gadd45 family protein [Candidatus Nanoarchaeia archaeon]MDD5054061.1 ribosomal L7Ae/L30e/S12e/Gadd45 family protein [Candidatus Nanoarchaeia archaeon]MDD5499553.1 ribosomal L7Ae/L30e/S12e/Gadd45 family protein [Candidatus Nanoarchaeia archaeon]